MRNMLFAENLARLLADSEITQDQLASRMGVNQTSVSRWLGGSEPRKQTLVKLADFFGVSADELKRGAAESESETHKTPEIILGANPIAVGLMREEPPLYLSGKTSDYSVAEFLREEARKQQEQAEVLLATARRLREAADLLDQK
jgi:transcriptional regulator with XRE-family HTH domain